MIYEWYNIRCFNVFIGYSRITFSFHFILEVECNLTCEHDGICAKDHNDDLQCFCPQGYSGQYCEHGKRISILDILHTHIIQIKVSHNQNSLKHSIPYWNIIDACATMDCYNGGTCSIEKHTGTPKCSCNNGYNGSHCEES